MAISMSLPFMSLYLYEKRGVSMAMVGVVLLITGVGSAVSQLFAGSLADRFGRRPLLIFTFSCSVLLFLGMAFLIGFSAPVPAIVAAFTLVRCALMMQRPPIQAIVADLAPADRLTETYGLLRIGGNLGFAAGPAIGGFLAVSLTYAWLFGLAALITLLALAFMFFSLRESYSRTPSKVNIASALAAGKDPNLLTFTLLCVLVFLVMGQLGTTLSVFTVSHAGFSTAQFGFLLTLNGLVIVVFQYPITWILKRFALYRSLVLGALLYATGYLILTWVGSYALALVAVAIITAGEIVFAPTTSAVVGEMATEHWRGRYMAFAGLSETIGFSFGPLIGGVLLDAFPAQPILTWGPIAALAFIAAIGFQRWGVKLKKPGPVEG
jgi:predicted MFS family arabinose efflux permease